VTLRFQNHRKYFEIYVEIFNFFLTTFDVYTGLIWWLYTWVYRLSSIDMNWGGQNYSFLLDLCRSSLWSKTYSVDSSAAVIISLQFQNSVEFFYSSPLSAQTKCRIGPSASWNLNLSPLSAQTKCRIGPSAFWNLNLMDFLYHWLMIVSELFQYSSFARLSAKLPRLGDSEVTFSVFESSCHYQSNHSKVEAIPLSALPSKDTTSELVGMFCQWKLK